MSAHPDHSGAQEFAAAPRLLVVDDEPSMLRALSRQLASRGFDVSPFGDGEEAKRAVAEREYDAAVLDFGLIGMTGVELMEQLRAIDPTLTIVLLSGTIEVPEAVRAIRRGAEDVQLKPPNLDLLQAALERGLERTRLHRSRRLLAAHVVDPYGVLDPSLAMQRVVRQVQHVAPLALPLLLIGEAGTGKRAIAEMVHQLAPQVDRTFVAIGLLDRSPESVESALHTALERSERAASHSRITLYLDDLGVLSAGAQQQLLSVLDASPTLRLIVSTRRDLADDARATRLLPSLYHRLAVLPINVPALRERGASAIATIGLRVVDRARIDVGEGPDGFTQAALDWLCNCPWPANIPQLHDTVMESFVRAIGESEIDTHHVAPSLVARGMHAGHAAPDAEDWSIRAAEKRQIVAVLGMVKNHRSQAAKLLGITRTTLYKKMDEYGIGVSGD
ncbi:sigma-54-dependent transcriptional regulator [Gemmatimonas groenlandica]|uniref:Sigma-54-dependent Fis family transcriptional regulator n=1 Tax=Gemmatimonas groenlandica TaxID=2732249 RepID=A0A6M4ITC8_9BACT|nr:response regulator [Gemmatimonas groenlandica]QJR36736.1 sigma-54-dependent Fis family transcriptional regulator [Gemmatimonas groenlandica]